MTAPGTHLHVFFADEDPAIRMAFERAIEGGGGTRASTFSSAEDCLAALSKSPCDVVVTDVRLAGMDGLSLLQEIRRRFPWVRVIFVTAYADASLAATAMKAGAADFLEKPLNQEELLAAIENTLKGSSPVPFPREGLSPSEIQILRLLLEGYTNREIAAALTRSPRTIEVHRRQLMRKFDAHNAFQLARRASALWLDK
jgi:two-component system, LuxR family, response regulator FixJ